jgi:tetratricopeptide (TPR) repeat protein
VPVSGWSSRRTSTACLDTNRLSGATKATTLKQRAVAYMHLGQHPRAIEDINQAIKLKSDDSDSYYLRGFAYRALGQYQRAVEDSTRAIGLESNFAAAFANRAFAYKALGNVTQARSDARRARDLDPSVKVPSF